MTAEVSAEAAIYFTVSTTLYAQVFGAQSLIVVAANTDVCVSCN